MTFFSISPLARRRNQVLRHLNLALAGCENVGLSTAACHVSMAIDTLTAPPVPIDMQAWQDWEPEEVTATAALLVEARSTFSKASSDLLQSVANNPRLHDLAIELLTAAVNCERAAMEFGAARERARPGGRP
jgi:hypothetical protein